MLAKLGWALCGSFCTLRESLSEMEKLKNDYDILPIVSYSVKDTDTRFGSADFFTSEIKRICSKSPIDSIKDSEPIGPTGLTDLMLISPCTGNTLAKIANGITDTPVTMAAKSHLRNSKPLVIALATNDALSSNLRNISTLLSRKNVYFVKMRQDDPIRKPDSLVADFSSIGETLALSQKGIQIRPLFI